jgi:hypothetical protein
MWQILLIHLLKSPAADATDALQFWRLIVQPCDEDDENDEVFLLFRFNGAPVEWNWQEKTEVLGEKPIPVPHCPSQIPHGPTRERGRLSPKGQLFSMQESNFGQLRIFYNADNLV